MSLFTNRPARAPRRRQWSLWLAAIVVAVGMTNTQAGHIVVIDDFTSDTLDPEWAAPVNVLNNASPAVPDYSLTTNPDKLTFTHTNTASTPSQFAMLRDDFRLEHDGDYVELTVNLQAVVGSTSAILGGIVLNSVSDSPVDRTNNYTMYMVGNGRVDVVRNTTIIGQSAAGTFTPGNDVVLRFTRLAADEVLSSYSVDGGMNFVAVPGITAAERVVGGFHAAGVYAGNNTLATTGTTWVYDDLVYFNAIPEPSTWAMLALGAFGLAMRRTTFRRT